MSGTWVTCKLESLRDVVKQDRFKLALVITEDLAVYKYTKENKGELSDLGSLGFSFDPENNSVLYWIRNDDGFYCYMEVEDEELLAYHPHHELFGKRIDKSLKEVLKGW